MKRYAFLAIAIIMAISVCAKEKLKVLYVGGSANVEVKFVEGLDPDMVKKSVKERMSHFDKFLRSRFTSVKSIHADDYTPSMSAGYDVTIFDGTPKKISDNELNGAEQVLPYDFTDAAICIASESEYVTRSLGCKNDWYCLCLQNYSHNWKKDHPIFKGPFKVNLPVETRPTPESTLMQHNMLKTECPAELEMWQVQTTVYEEGKNTRIGMVSGDGGYTDSPDAEFISGGESAKPIQAVAIGRHGNFLHWGFASDPAEMTPAGKDVFANAVVYISKFKGHPIIARKLDRGSYVRDESLQWLDYSIAKDSWQNKETFNKSVREDLLKKGDPNAKFYESEPYHEFVKKYSPELYEVFGTDTEEYFRFYKKNYPYLYRDPENSFRMKVDTDLREIGVANYDIAMLDSAITIWERGGKESAKGERLLKRYTLCNFATPQEYRNWVDTNRDNLFFSEAGGFLWLVNTNVPNAVGNDYTALILDLKAKNEARAKAYEAKKAKQVPPLATSRDNPVALASAIRTDANGAKEMVITMTIHPGYHAYAAVDEKDVFIKTTLDLTYPEGIEPDGEMIMPPAQSTGNATSHYTGTVQFRQKIKGEGKGEISAKVRYQVCDNSECKIPSTQVLKENI